MSRIDEALKRASGEMVADYPASSKASERAGRRPDDVLEYYPRESRTPVDRGVGGAEFGQSRSIAAPRTGNRRQLAPFDPSIDGKLIVSDHASPVAVEQYRRLAASLHELQVERGLKTLMVTSALPQEGKTLTVANLALTLSESYKRRVLLIDADLRRPSIHTVFRLPNTAGLSDGLRTGPADLAFLEVSPFLSVLPAGTPDQNPMAKLTSEGMRALLEESNKRFDWVLLDAPPVGLMPDAHLLAQQIEAVIFVIRAGSTPHRVIDRAIEEIGRECILGTVLNCAEEDSMPDTGYYRDYYAPK